MIEFKKFNLDDDDIQFFLSIEDYCINGQSEIVLVYKGKSFVLQPSGKSVQVYAYGEILGDYENIDDLFLNHKIDGVPLIKLIKELEFAD